MIDSWKAFDSLRNVSLIAKIATYGVDYHCVSVIVIS